MIETTLSLEPEKAEATPVISYEVRPLTELSTAELDALRSLGAISPDAHPFQTPEFVTFATASPGHGPFALLAASGDSLVGYWLGFFVRYRRLPWTLHLAMARSGPVLQPDLPGGRRDSVLREFVLLLQRFARQEGATRAVVTTETVYGERLDPPLRAASFERRELATYLIDLRPPLDDILRRVDRSARTGTRTSRRRGVSVVPAESSEEVQAFRRALARTLRQGGLTIPLPSDYLDRLHRLRASSAAHVSVAKHDGRVIGGHLILSLGDPAIYYQAATSERSLRSGDLLTWQCVEAAKELGHEWLDMLSVEVDPPPNSREAGIRRFKAKWGGSLVSTPVYAYRLPGPKAYGLLRGLARRLR